ncbi:50S rRNA methyltransferase [Planomonospora sphaerica]|uniref:50S rRNA methyltransferase n=1 Tax=Planomonospora sphaerica TaxID=161355 RepID=A0A161LLZ7_9ACTN|nr:methyltransferase [Planomonospora sphaerica]GAT69977.1 50S rRNA methyltransferase [Planomonospora sphaerica]
MNRLTTPRGELALARFPEDPRDLLRAWDAADEYLLRHLDGTAGEAAGGAGGVTGGGPVDLSGTVVVAGDRWGALTTALAGHRPVQITDSFLAQEATRANLERNGIGPDRVRLLSTRDAPPDRIDVLLVRVPRSLALLEDQLHRLAPRVHAGTVVVGTGMVTEIHTSTLRLFERILGPTRTSLAVRKARLILCAPDPALPRTASPWPKSYELPGGVGPASGLTAVNHAGVFCADRLDIGTRFLLRHLPRRRGPERVVDLGCGNGVVGTAAALDNPEAEVLFVDESYQAVASAEATFLANTAPGPGADTTPGAGADTAPGAGAEAGTGPGTRIGARRIGAEAGPGRRAEFRVGDGLSGVPARTVDLVLNNPPFHSHRATTDATAWRMFTGSRAALRRGGELWVVGNRHLGYHAKLRRLFGNCEVVASDPKFVVLRAVKR